MKMEAKLHRKFSEKDLAVIRSGKDINNMNPGWVQQ